LVLRKAGEEYKLTAKDTGSSPVLTAKKKIIMEIILFFLANLAIYAFIDTVIKKRTKVLWKQNFIIALLVTLLYAIL
jgi:hypothetical protein